MPVQFSPIEVRDNRILAFVRALESVYVNGGVVFGGFTFEDGDSDALAWCVDGPSPRDVNFGPLVTSDVFWHSFPELDISEGLRGMHQFEWVEPFCLDGQLAATLFHGGAYAKFAGTSREAKMMANEFCEALFQWRYEDIMVFYCMETWLWWFYDMGWDNTWFVIDREKKSIWMLCTTDQD
jgi:hypothetical protein